MSGKELDIKAPPEETEESEPLKDSTNASDAFRRQWADVTAAFGRNATKPEGTSFENQGQINKMTIPNGWEAGKEQISMQHGSSYKEFHPKDNQDCQMGFYYRGIPTHEKTGESFKNLLMQEPHELTKEELEKVKDTVGERGNPDNFDITSKRTERVDGKTVLVLEGQYKNLKQDAKNIYVAANEKGTVVQEIFFQAPTDKFKKYANEANEAFKTIQWK